MISLGVFWKSHWRTKRSMVNMGVVESAPYSFTKNSFLFAERWLNGIRVVYGRPLMPCIGRGF